MAIPRFYCPPPLHASTRFELPPAAAHHASRVLRLRVNDEVRIFDGVGNELQGHIGEIQGKRVALENLQNCTVRSESSLQVVLAQALSSNEKMDWVIQKATELGVTEIQPIQTQRSMTKLTGERAEKRTQHWHGITIAACEQCGRNMLPEVHTPQEFGSWITALGEVPGSKFILLPEAAATLRDQSEPQGKTTLLIGPEGGFGIDEIQAARQASFVAIRLGARVLRTETAAVAGIAALETLWGDLG